MSPSLDELRLPAWAVRPMLRALLFPMSSPRIPAPAQRRYLDLVSRTMRSVGGVRVEADRLGGRDALSATPEGHRPGQTILYFHGGAYRSGSPISRRPFATRLALATGSVVRLPSYRLAPEHPCPAAIEDALAAYRALLESGQDPTLLTLGGDSAGAGLALALALRLRDAGEPLPAAILALCPWVDLTMSGASLHLNGPREPIVSRDSLSAAALAYAGDLDPASPDLSPALADLAGLPPLVVQSGGDDILVDDAELLARRAREAGIAVDYRRYDDLWHDFQTQAGLLRAADLALDDAAASLAAAR